MKDYVAAGVWTPYRQPQRKKALDGQETWLKECLRQHHGNADVIRQELTAEKGIIVSLRTVERAVQLSPGACGRGESRRRRRRCCGHSASTKRLWEGF